MQENNPMFDPTIRDKAVTKMKESWTPARRKEQSIRRQGVNNISEAGLERLRSTWLGIERPRKPGQHDNIRKSMSIGEWITPFGTFLNPTQASLSETNTDKISRHIIKKNCLQGISGYKFNPRNDM